VNLDIFDRRSAERFAQLLDETNGGLRHHARGQADDQLAELVSIGHTLAAVRPAVRVDVDAEFRTGLRAMLVATAERDGIGDTAVSETAPGVHAAVRESHRRSLLGVGSARRIRARGAIVIGVAVGAVAVSGLSSASENSGPGDALYGVKRSTERAQLALAGSDVTRGQLSLDFARTRLAEAAAMDGDNTDFPDVLADMDNDTTQGVRLLTTSAVSRTDKTPLTTVDTFVSGQRKVIGPIIDKLTPGNRERALQSMTLLDDIDRRARGLKAAIDCGPEGVAGADALGPKPHSCGNGVTGTEKSDDVGAQTGAGSNGKSGSKARPERNAPADPRATGDAGGPVGGAAATTPARPGLAPTTAPAEAPADTPDEPADQQDDGFLGGLLGGIFG
jgi:hypothetical protein